MEKKNCMQFTNRNTADISSLVELALEKYGYPKDLVIRYAFIFEEVLLRWQKEYDGETAVEFSRSETGSGFRLEISVAGEKSDPLLDSMTEDVLESLISRLKSRLGGELRYRYRKGRNCVFVSLPKKNPEQKLFDRNLFLLSVPVILQFLVMNLSSVLDSVMLSFFRPSSLSAASLVAGYTMLFNSFIMSMQEGMTVVFSKYWGERKFDDSRRICALTCLLQGAVGILFFLLAEFFSGFVMNFYTDIPEIRAEGIVYLKAIAPYYLFTAVGEVYICFMRSTGKVTRSSVFAVASQVVNCLMNGVLIFGLFGIPALGIAGAGISTSISGIFLFGLTAGEYFHAKTLQLKSTHFLTIRKELVREYSRLTVPITFKHVSYYAASNVISSVIGHTNENAVAAIAVKNTVYNMVSSISQGISSVCTLVMAPLMNGKSREKALRNGSFAVRFAVRAGIVMSAVFLLAYFLVPYLFGQISDQEMGYIRLVWLIAAASLFFACLNQCTNCAALLPSGDVRPVIIIDVTVMWGVIVVFLLLGSLVLNLSCEVLLIVGMADEILSCPFKYGRYRSKKWAGLLK